MVYYTCASLKGRVRHNQLSQTIGAADKPGYVMPVGQAHQVGETADGLALWRLTVHGAELPERFIIVDGAFIEVDSGSAPVQ
jgi:hypothetical protein